MIELKGKYNKDCYIFIDEIEQEAISLIQNILDQHVSENVPVRIMPDVHAGKGIVIGFTMPLTSMLNPSYVGVDIGCGMLSAECPDYTSNLDLKHIDDYIRKNVPMGFDIHKYSVTNSCPYNEVQEIANKFTDAFNIKFNTTYKAPTYSDHWLSKKLKTIGMEADKFYNSLGTMGGGNHFIEIGQAQNSKKYWITIHSGSRNFGLKIADYWTNVAKGKVIIASQEYNKEYDEIILNTFPKNLIPIKLKALKGKYELGINKEFLTKDNLICYLYDMIFAQQYALWNRREILKIVQREMNIFKFPTIIHTIHNYVDFNDMMIRKGAISSYVGQKMIIPFNMRDGILLCEGTSNSEWNYSAPHGAGRLMSRSQAKQEIDLQNFKE